MTDRLIAYVTDAGYIVPSLVSAQQVSRTAAADLADIIIFTVGLDPELVDYIGSTEAFARIRIIPIDAKKYAPTSNVYFEQGHVPQATLGRLVLSDYIPAQYEHIIYIDGDTQVVGDISPLIAYDVPQGKIAAANESFFLEEDQTQSRLQYLANLGLHDPGQYFNAGVLSFRKDTWSAIGPRALEYFLQNPQICLFHDQSALNAICRDLRVAISPLYNFHTGFAELQVSGKHRPRIVHFTGSEKPWNYQAWPWPLAYYKPYHAVMKGGKFDNVFRITPASRAKYLSRSFHKADKYKSQFKNMIGRRGRLLKYLEESNFPF